MFKQTCTSKNTSVNSAKLPAVFKKINYGALTWNSDGSYRRLLIVDYGCGKYYNTTSGLLSQIIGPLYPDLEWAYLAYDPYWKPWDVKTHDNLTLEDWIVRWKTVNKNGVVICVCANVLNVIDNRAEVRYIKDRLWNISEYSFFSVYEGDKSGIAKTTKKDCFQRNLPLMAYADDHFFSTKNGVLLNPEAEKFIYFKTPRYSF